MKLLINVLGLAAAGYLGYVLEPNLRPSLTGQTPSRVEAGRNKKVILRMPADLPQINLADLTADQLPPKVLLKSDVKVTDSASGTQVIIPAGNRAKLVRIEGGNAVVSPGEGPFLGLVPVTDTDLFQQLAANPPGTKTVDEPVIPTEIPAPVVSTPKDSEEPVKAPLPEPLPKPAPETTPANEPTPDSTDNSDDVVKMMQTSIKNGQIKEFTFDQILEWTAAAPEIIEGETYQTGLASYEGETIFGVKKIQAKALIKGGKVLRWIWPKSGMDIK